jgi:hypothetical protein
MIIDRKRKEKSKRCDRIDLLGELSEFVEREGGGNKEVIRDGLQLEINRVELGGLNENEVRNEKLNKN